MNDERANGTCFGVMIALAVISAIFIIAPHIPSFNDDVESKSFLMGDDFVDVDIRMGDLDGYIGGIYRVGTAYMFSNMYVTPNDPTVCKVYSLLEERMSGMSDSDKADYLLRFVHKNVDYYTDEHSYGIADYVQMPAETLYLKRGDCEDVSFLLYTLYLKAGLDAVVVMNGSHVTVGVNVPCGQPNYIVHDGKRYYSAEATCYYGIGMTTLDNPDIVIKPESPQFPIFILAMALSGIVLLTVLEFKDKPVLKRFRKNTIGV